MDTALDDIAFLANSENRVAVLETLVEAPRSRDEIRARVDASRVTVARILRELEARAWADESSREYRATPLGEWVYEAFTGVLDEISAERRLRAPMQWLPADVLTFDIRQLHDAEVVLPEGNDATAPVRRIIEFHRSGARIRGSLRVIAPVIIENLWELTVKGTTRLEVVVAPEVLDVIRSHPPSERRFREMLAEEHVRVHTLDEVPLSVGIVDDTVVINLTDEQGILRGAVKTDDETVHEWAVELFETCCRQATPVHPELVTA